MRLLPAVSLQQIACFVSKTECKFQVFCYCCERKDFKDFCGIFFFSFHPSLPLLATTSGQRQFAEPGSDSDEDHVNAMDQDTGIKVDNSLRIWTAA